MAGAAQPEQEDSFLFIEIHHLDMAPVRGDVGAEGIQGSLDPIEDVHARYAKDYILLIGSEYNGSHQTTLASPVTSHESQHED
jgi:hypothetical protein